MKKIFILIFLSLFFVSCNQEIQNKTTTLDNNEKKEMATYNE